MLLAVYYLLIFCYFVDDCHGAYWRPKLVYQSQGRKYYENVNFGLHCKFNSSPPANVIWYKNGVDMANIYDTRVYSKAIIMTSPIITMYRLYINHARTTDTGTYKCTGINSQGLGESGTISIFVQGPSKPNFHSPLENVTLYLSQQYEVQCRAYADPPGDLKYSWSKKGGYIDDIKVTDLGDGRLMISEARMSDTGQYSCTARNSAGESTTSLFIKVVTDPSWVQMPTQNVTAEVGQNITISCTFVGSSQDLRVNWFDKENHPLVKGASIKKVNEHYKAELKFDTLSVTHNGKYTVQISNQQDSISAAVFIRVFAKPDVTIKEGKELTVTEGQKVHLICEVKGYPSPTVTWENADNTVLTRTSADVNQPGQTVIATLGYIFEARKGLSELNCRGKNARGEDIQIIKFIVTEKDGVPPTDGKSDKTKTVKTSNLAFIILGIAAVVIVLILVSLAYFIYSRRKRAGNIPQTNFVVRYEREDSDPETAELLDDDGKARVQSPDIKSSTEHIYSTPDVHFQRKNDRHASVKNLDKSQKALQASLYKKNSRHHNVYSVSPVCSVGQGGPIPYENLLLEKVLGEGNFGRVMKGKVTFDDNNVREVAVKMLKDNASFKERADIIAELNTMKKLSHHPNVISLLGWCITDDNVFIVEEFIPKGNLLKFLRSSRHMLQETYQNFSSAESGISEKELLSVAWQVASGMKYLSSMKIVHRDLAARNVLIGHENICKVCDFGLARDIYTSNEYKKNSGGALPVRWMAYESLFHGIYTTESDVWSFGILLWEIVTLGDIPYPDHPNTEKVLDSLEKGERLGKPIHCSDDLYGLMKECWNQTPADRPDFVVLCQKMGGMLYDQKIHINLGKLEEYYEKLKQEEYDDAAEVSNGPLLAP